MKYPIVGILILLGLLGAGCLGRGSTEDSSVAPELDREAILFEARKNGLIMDEEEAARMATTMLTVDMVGRMVSDVDPYLKMDRRSWPSAALADVTGGESFGLAHARVDGQFVLVVELGGLPEPAAGYAYRGWLVDRGQEMRVVSMGTVTKTQNGHAQVYVSATDLSDYNFYVVTLDADEVNPAPGEHILEGGFR